MAALLTVGILSYFSAEVGNGSDGLVVFPEKVLAMSGHRLGYSLVAAGGFVTAAAVLWWATFYSAVLENAA